MKAEDYDILIERPGADDPRITLVRSIAQGALVNIGQITGSYTSGNITLAGKSILNLSRLDREATLQLLAFWRARIEGREPGVAAEDAIVKRFLASEEKVIAGRSH